MAIRNWKCGKWRARKKIEDSKRPVALLLAFTRIMMSLFSLTIEVEGILVIDKKVCVYTDILHRLVV